MRKMKKFRVILVLFSSAVLFQSNLNLIQKKGLVQFQFNLSDGENLDLYKFISSEEFTRKIELSSSVFEVHSDFETFQKSAIVRSLAPKGIQPANLVEAIMVNFEQDIVGYFRIDPGLVIDQRYSDFIFFDNEYHWDLYNDFNLYYLKIFENEVARKLAFNSALDLVLELVNKYPSDFKKGVLSQIDECILFTNNLKNKPALLLEEDPDFLQEVGYYKGFIFRRIRNSKVPINEVLSYLNEAKLKVQAAVPNDASALIEFEFNKEFKIFFGADSKYYLYSNLNQKLVSIQSFPTSVTVYSDGGQNFYLIEFDNGTKSLFGRDLDLKY